MVNNVQIFRSGVYRVRCSRARGHEIFETLLRPPEVSSTDSAAEAKREKLQSDSLWRLIASSEANSHFTVPWAFPGLAKIWFYATKYQGSEMLFLNTSWEYIWRGVVSDEHVKEHRFAALLVTLFRIQIRSLSSFFCSVPSVDPLRGGEAERTREAQHRLPTLEPAFFSSLFWVHTGIQKNISFRNTWTLSFEVNVRKKF